MSPDLCQQPLGSDAAAGIAEQHLQKAQFKFGKAYRHTTVDRDRMLFWVESHSAGDERRGTFNSGAAHERFDPREKSTGTEGLRQEVIGAELQRLHEIFFLATYGEHHDRHA